MKTHTWPPGIWNDAQYDFTIKEMKIETTVRYYLTPVQMAIILKKESSAGKGVEKLEPL